MPYYEYMCPDGHGTTLPTGDMPSCPRVPVYPFTPETRTSACPYSSLQVVPYESMHSETAWAQVPPVGMGPGVYPGTCPCRHGRACAQAGQVDGEPGRGHILDMQTSRAGLNDRGQIVESCRDQGKSKTFEHGLQAYMYSLVALLAIT